MARRVGDRVPQSYFRKLQAGDPIWECRIQCAGNIYRMLGFFQTGGVLVLTRGFRKKSARTPRLEIRRAEMCRRDHLNRRRHE